MKETNEESHPSFGMVGISHTSSNGTTLVGSEFKHNHYVALTIRRASKMRDLSHEWWFGREELIEINLSEAQFIELMARPNMGSGVPCTLNHIAGKRVEPPPAPVPEREKYRADLQADANRCVKDLNEAHAELLAAIESGKVGKTALKGIADKIKYAGMAVSNGIPFVEKSFEEAMEKTVHHAAAEIEATVSNMVMRLGIEKLHELADAAPKLLESGE